MVGPVLSFGIKDKINFVGYSLSSIVFYFCFLVGKIYKTFIILHSLPLIFSFPILFTLEVG